MNPVARMPLDFFIAKRLAMISRRDDLRIILSNQEMSADAAFRLLTLHRVLLGQVPPQWAAFAGE